MAASDPLDIEKLFSFQFCKVDEMKYEHGQQQFSYVSPLQNLKDII